MKMYVFERLDKVSRNYHSEGGLVVVAKDRTQAEELIEAEGDIVITEDDWKDVVEYELKSRPKVEPIVFVFPDAGCC